MTPELSDLTALPALAAAVDGARDAIAALAMHPANRRNWPKSAAAAAMIAARASAALDGGHQALPAAERAVTDPVLAGAVRSMAAIAGLATTFGRAPLQAIARLHVLAAADLADPTALGRPSGDPRAAARLAGVAELVTSRRVAAPVVVALVHAELMVAMPFAQANGVVARAAGRLAMVQSGLDPLALSTPEVVFFRNGTKYRILLDRYAAGDLTAVAEWILFSCEALRAGAEEGRRIADAID